MHDTVLQHEDRVHGNPLLQPTRDDLLLGIEQRLKAQATGSGGKPGTYNCLEHDIENIPVETLRERPVGDSVLALIADELDSRGFKTGGSVGGIMDAMQWTRMGIHRISCGCCGENISAQEAIRRIYYTPMVGELQEEADRRADAARRALV